MTTKLNEAFKRFRKAGLIARQNFSCCSSCAGYEIATDVEAMIDAGKPAPKGCAFYHRQDADALKPPRWHRKGEQRQMAIRYGQIGTEKHGDIGLPTVEVGKLIVGILTDIGLVYEWNGNPDTVIYIDVGDALTEAPPAPPAPTRLPRRASARALASQTQRANAADAAALALINAVEA